MEQLESYGFNHPSNTIISGPSNSGKSEILGKILKSADTLFNPPPLRKLLFFREEQPIYQQWYESGFISDKQKGMPERSELLAKLSEYKEGGGCIVLFDDFASLVEENRDDFIFYFTIGSHHYNCSFFLVLHSLFSPALRILSLNTHRFVLTRSPRDVSQVRTLAAQAFPGRTRFIVDAYENATDYSYGFLVLDFSPNVDKRLRVVGNIFMEGAIMVFTCKNLGSIRSDKMEPAFRKQALIPWVEYLRLREKAEAKHASITNTTLCGQISKCSNLPQNNQPPYPTIKDNDLVLQKVGDTPPVKDINITQNHTIPQTKVMEEEPPYQPMPTQLHAVIPTPESDLRTVVKSPLANNGNISNPSHIPTDPSSEPPKLPQPLDTTDPSTTLTNIPILTNNSHPTLTYQPSQTVGLLPLAPRIPLSSLPSLATPKSRKQGQNSTPQRAVENMMEVPADSSYPISLLRDQDYQVNPINFPLNATEKKKKKKKNANIRKSIFKPSEPISDTQEGRIVVEKEIKKHKRKGTFLTKPRPSLPPKQHKLNRGEKRKISKDGMNRIKSLKTKHNPLTRTDFDIW